MAIVGAMARVLLVTDDVWVENDVRAALSEPGTEFILVSDPRAAAATAAQDGAEVAVVDLQVGSMGGMAVIRALRTAVDNGELDRVRMVLLLDRSADDFLARRAGADASVLKPFTAQQLRAATTPQQRV